MAAPNLRTTKTEQTIHSTTTTMTEGGVVAEEAEVEVEGEKSSDAPTLPLLHQWEVGTSGGSTVEQSSHRNHHRRQD